jgi:hypothetical protein
MQAHSMNLLKQARKIALSTHLQASSGRPGRSRNPIPRQRLHFADERARVSERFHSIVSSFRLLGFGPAEFCSGLMLNSNKYSSIE